MRWDSEEWRIFHIFWLSLEMRRFRCWRRGDLKFGMSQELRVIESDATHNHLIDSHLCWMKLNLERSKGWKTFLTFLFHVRPKENFHSNFKKLNLEKQSQYSCDNGTINRAASFSFISRRIWKSEIFKFSPVGEYLFSVQKEKIFRTIFFKWNFGKYSQKETWDTFYSISNLTTILRNCWKEEICEILESDQRSLPCFPDFGSFFLCWI